MRPHAPVSVAGAAFSYDGNGNLVSGSGSGSGRALAYDGDNRPVSVTTAAGTTVYTYGPSGGRRLDRHPGARRFRAGGAGDDLLCERR